LPTAEVSDERPDEMPSAALVLLRSALAVLVVPIEMCSAPW
jgi:hypothetical protein